MSEQLVGPFREIVPVRLIQPELDFNSQNNSIARNLIADVLRFYAGTNDKTIN